VATTSSALHVGTSLVVDFCDVDDGETIPVFRVAPELG
jgi:hypothetical protein